MSRKPVLVAVAAVVVVAALVAFIGRDSSDHHEARSLPAVEGTTPPTDYRIVYRVTTPDSSSEEEHVVHRPFDAYVVQRTTDGEITAERWSELGSLTTRSQGADAVRISTAIAPAVSDLRPEQFQASLVDAGQLVLRDVPVDVNGRTCRLVSEAGEAKTAGGGPVDAGDLGSVPVLVSRCVDAVGLVIEERWTTPDGERVLTKRAVELEVGAEVPDIHVPAADPLGDDQGNGAVREVAPDEAPPFLEQFELPEPEGFTFVGRYAVMPARLGLTPEDLASGVAVALYTDVWRRGPDLLLLDQGATRGTAAPFDPRTRVGDAQVPALGTAELAMDLRSAEVRSTRPDDGFVRLSGTIPPAELLRLARTLTALQEATP